MKPKVHEHPEKNSMNVRKKKWLVLLGGGILLLSSVQLRAQSDWNKLPMDEMASRDTISKNGYTLVFLNQDSALDQRVKQRLIDAFFTVYPEEAQAYNPHTSAKVIFFVDPAYKGVAATAGNIVRFNPAWFHKNPEDIDVVTHEVMHIVQAYHGGAGPGWLTEGIADYVRYKFGVNNKDADWTLTEYRAGQSYKNAYRITARFLVWLEEKKHPGIVKELDAAMRSHTYTPGIWQQLTGQTVDDLWNEYGESPVI